MKTSRRLLRMIFGFIALSGAQALAGSEDSVVKLISGPCHQSDRTFVGSGVVIEIHGEQYIATSEHVVTTEEKYCSRAITSLGQSAEAKLLRSDWLNGLALLKVQGSLAVSAIHLDQFKESSQSSTLVKIIGFPRNLNKVLEDSAKILVNESNRSPIAGVKTVIEIKGLHGENGMSGGGLFNASGEFLGLLSHQVFVAAPGQHSITESFSSRQAVNGDDIVVIPSLAIKNWINETLASPGLANYSRDPVSQLRGDANHAFESVIGPGFKLNLNPSAALRSSLVKPSKNGGDGVGIGGTDDDSNQNTVTIELKNLGELQAAEASHAVPSWFNDLNKELSRKQKIEIKALVRFDVSDQPTELPEVIQIENLAQFVELSLRNDASSTASKFEVLPVLSTAETSSASDEKLKLIGALIAFFRSAAPETTSLLNRIGALAALRAQYGTQFDEINRQIELLRRDREQWAKLSILDFDKTVELNTLLRERPSGL